MPQPYQLSSQAAASNKPAASRPPSSIPLPPRGPSGAPPALPVSGRPSVVVPSGSVRVPVPASLPARAASVLSSVLKKPSVNIKRFFPGDALFDKYSLLETAVQGVEDAAEAASGVASLGSIANKYFSSQAAQATQAVTNWGRKAILAAGPKAITTANAVIPHVPKAVAGARFIGSKPVQLALWGLDAARLLDPEYREEARKSIDNFDDAKAFSFDSVFQTSDRPFSTASGLSEAYFENHGLPKGIPFLPDNQGLQNAKDALYRQEKRMMEERLRLLDESRVSQTRR
jgi:hypothetical protein